MINDELYHFGIKGMKWGVRRYQNEDGSLTEAGRRHYDVMEARELAKAERTKERIQKRAIRSEEKKAEKEYKRTQKTLRRSERLSKKEYKRALKLAKKEEILAKLNIEKDLKIARINKGTMTAGEKWLAGFADEFGKGMGKNVGKVLDIKGWTEEKTKKQQAYGNILTGKSNLLDKYINIEKLNEDDRAILETLIKQYKL